MGHRGATYVGACGALPRSCAGAERLQRRPRPELRYLTKPFGAGELLARVRAKLRRPCVAAGKEPEPVFRFGEKYGLLSVLVANAGRVLTQRQLLRELEGPAHAEQSPYVRIYMGHLRQKLEADPAQPRHLLPETAAGYWLVP